ncbi:MAG: hypothetical protein HY748_15350 [Elusimicrobia bacterium]|nr:hypothetical protein [Elusimicrobiota bacterium]
MSWIADPSAEERHLVAGPKAMADLAALLGLGGDWRLEAACAQGRRNVRLALRRGGAVEDGGRRLVFYLVPRDSSGASGISLSIEGPSGPAVTKLLGVLAARLGARTLEDVVLLMEADPASFAERRAAGRGEDNLKVPYVGSPFGLQDAGWRNFYGDQDFEVLLGVPECTYDRTLTLEYADLECFYARPELDVRRWSFLDWPNDKEDEIGGGRSAAIAIELDEKDMILGTTEKADAVVAKVRELTAAGHYLVVCHLCTPIVMGEDLCGLARRVEKIVGCKPVSWSQKDRDNLDNFGEFLRETLGAPGFFDGPADPSAVNLFHFPEPYRKAELAPFLEDIGVKVNAAVFPMMDFPSVERLPKAVSQVFCERSSYPVKLKELLGRAGRKIVSVPAPYGLAGAKACLGLIAAAAGRAQAFEAAWAERMAGVMPVWEEKKARAAEHRVAFVVSEATLPRLFQVRYGFGAPMATMVAEMGFGIDFLYYDPHGERPCAPKETPSARMKSFRGPWELDELLAQGDFQAVYSDICFDWRITKAGKARFSSRNFDMGIGGAMRAFEGLLGACGMPFYKRYAPHLARVPRRIHV